MRGRVAPARGPQQVQLRGPLPAALLVTTDGIRVLRVGEGAAGAGGGGGEGRAREVAAQAEREEGGGGVGGGLGEHDAEERGGRAIRLVARGGPGQPGVLRVHAHVGRPCRPRAGAEAQRAVGRDVGLDEEEVRPRHVGDEEDHRLRRAGRRHVDADVPRRPRAEALDKERDHYQARVVVGAHEAGRQREGGRRVGRQHRDAHVLRVRPGPSAAQDAAVVLRDDGDLRVAEAAGEQGEAQRCGGGRGGDGGGRERENVVARGTHQQRDVLRALLPGAGGDGGDDGVGPVAAPFRHRDGVGAQREGRGVVHAGDGDREVLRARRRVGARPIGNVYLECCDSRVVRRQHET
mmetsp:Transcript_6102/g.19660  ORF Transcript_6102/g.19660 Transcript_6102/m.19660 type:complete len:349 (+) Transcript_6102:865-1911(+)